MEMQPNRVKPENKIKVAQDKKALSGTKRRRQRAKIILEETKKMTPKTRTKRQKRLDVAPTLEKLMAIDSGFRSTVANSPRRYSPSEDMEKYPSSPSQDEDCHLKKPRMDEEEHHGLSSFPKRRKSRTRYISFCM